MKSLEAAAGRLCDAQRSHVQREGARICHNAPNPDRLNTDSTCAKSGSGQQEIGRVVQGRDRAEQIATLCRRLPTWQSPLAPADLATPR